MYPQFPVSFRRCYLANEIRKYLVCVADPSVTEVAKLNSNRSATAATYSHRTLQCLVVSDPDRIRANTRFPLGALCLTFRGRGLNFLNVATE